MSGRGWWWEVARRQHGLVTRAQALGAGVSSSALGRLVSCGEFVRVFDGVYRVASAPVRWEQRPLAVVLATHGPVAFSHVTAGVLHGLDGLPATPSYELHLTLPRGHRLTLEAVAVHRTNAPARVTRRHGLPVTQLGPTVLDLASMLAPEPLELALDSAQRQVPDLGRWLTRLLEERPRRGRRGLATLRELLALRMGNGAESALEVKVWRSLRRARVPLPERQVEVVDEQGFVTRVDFAWRAQRVALHVDGYRWHHHRARVARDAEQRRRLTVLGWKQLVVTHGSLMGDAWLRDVKQTLVNQLELRWGNCASKEVVRPGLPMPCGSRESPSTSNHGHSRREASTLCLQLPASWEVGVTRSR